MSDITDLVTALGGNSRVPAFYDRRFGENLSGGKLASWDDARGSVGFGPNFPGIGSPKPSVDGTTGVITCDGTQNGILTAIDAVPNPNAQATFIYVGTLKAGSNFPFLVKQNTNADYIGLWSGAGGNAHLFITATGDVGDLLEPLSSSTRLAFLSVPPQYPGTGHGIVAYTAEVWGRMRLWLNDNNYLSTEAFRLSVGNVDGTSFQPADVSAIIVVDHQLNGTEQDAVTAWASTYHSAVYRSSPPTGVIFEGNSIFRGYGLSSPTTQSIPAVTMADPAFAGMEYANASVDGVTGTTILSNQPHRTMPTYWASRPKMAYVYLELTNDLNTGTPEATARQNVIDACTAAKNRGFRVVVTTCLPNNQFIGATETARQNINAYIRANYATFAHAMADIASIPSMANPNDTSVYQDGTHPTATGASNCALDATNGVKQALLAALASGPSPALFDYYRNHL